MGRAGLWLERRTIVAVVMAVLLCGLLSMPLRARAAEAVDTWDGTADTSWYTENPDATEFTISTAEELAGLAQLVNSSSKNSTTFSEKTIVLNSDIDLSGHEWIPIGRFQGAGDPFQGTFDGRGHSVLGMTCTTAGDYSSGLFGCIQKGKISNVSLIDVNIDVTGTSRLVGGVLVAYVETEGSNGVPEGTVTYVENCYTSGTFVGLNEYLLQVGGVVGMAQGSAVLKNCGSSVDIKVVAGEWGAAVAGLVGIWETPHRAAAAISDSYFDGSINVSGNYVDAAGIVNIASKYDVAYPDTPSVVNCAVFTGAVSASGENTEEAALITKYGVNGVSGAPNFVVKNCVWSAEGPDPIYLIDGADSTITKPSEIDFGQAVEDFSSSSLLDQLNADASQGVTWVAGVDGHPVFSWQKSLALADYSAVTTALAGIPADLSLYTDESVAALNTVKNSVVENLPVSRQGEVAKMAADITAAISDLAYKPADYTAVKEAIAKASALVRSNYVDLSNLDAALAAVVEGKNITEQAAVTKMAADIEVALNALELKPADYTAVKAALDKAAALNGDDYVDFSQVDAAVKAVVEGKDITEQADVDAMAQAIEDAIAALEKKPAPEPEPEPEPEPQPVVHTVTFVWGGEAASAVVKVEDGKQITAPTDAPELEGYSFTGAWYLTRAEDRTLSDEYNFSTPVTSDLTLYAGWIADQIPVGPEGGETANPEGETSDGSDNKVSEVKPTSPKSSAVPETSDASLATQSLVLLATGTVAFVGARHIRRRAS